MQVQQSPACPLRRQKRHQEHSGKRRQQQGQRRHVPAPARMWRAQALASAPHDPDQQRAGQQDCEQGPGKHGVIGQDALQGQYDQPPHRLRQPRQAPDPARGLAGTRQHGHEMDHGGKNQRHDPDGEGQMRYRRRATLPAHRQGNGKKQGQQGDGDGNQHVFGNTVMAPGAGNRRMIGLYGQAAETDRPRPAENEFRQPQGKPPAWPHSESTAIRVSACP